MAFFCLSSSQKTAAHFGVFVKSFLKKNEVFFQEQGYCAEGKCYKNRGENIILENVEALKNKSFEFPRIHFLSKGWKNKSGTWDSSKIWHTVPSGGYNSIMIFLEH